MSSDQMAAKKPVQNHNGYNETVFTGKDEQLQNVVEYVMSKGFIPNDLVQNEVNWFYR